MREETDPTDIPGPGRVAVLKRTAREFKDDNLTDWAAALTYYAVLALFPALLALVALVGIFGQYPQTTNALLDIVRQISGNDSALDGLKETIDGIVRNKGGAGALLGLGLAGALWSASGYIGAFMRASNAIYEVPEGRPFWKLRPMQVLVTLSVVLLVALLLVALVVTGPVAKAVGDQVGPSARLPKIQWLSPGAIVALVIWIIASAAFGFYVANFGSYNKTYGTLGGAISLLVWMWITNLAVLFGQELNAEIERGRELTAGLPAERELQLAPRGKPKDLEAEGAQISREGRFAGPSRTHTP
jgi:membrane protein